MRKLSAALVVAAMAMPCAAFADHMGKFSDMDTNKDGMISKSEAMAHHEKMFDMKDTNKDGQISKAEYDAAMAKHKSMWSKAKDKMGMDHNANDTNSMNNNTTEVDKNMAK